MHESKRGAGGEDSRAIVEAMIHPVRGRILIVVQERAPVSAAQVAELVQEPVQAVRYHLRYLVKAGLIESSEGQVKRGVVERRYRPLRVPLLWDEEMASLGESERLKIAIAILTAIFADATRAVKAKTISHHQPHMTRVSVEVDPQGWMELRQIHRVAFEEVERVKTLAIERAANTSDDSILVVSGLLCFQAPPIRV